MRKMKEAFKKIGKFILGVPLIIKIMICGVLGVAFDFGIELGTAKSVPAAVYSVIEAEDMKELVKIKKSEDDSGYYLDFVDDFDDKLEKIIKKANNENGLHILPDDKEFLKKLIKAEAITQFPNLGGNIPENSEGFQGVIDVRRITPNKEKGSIDSNPGRGETTNIEQENNDNDVNEVSNDEAIVQEWSQGQSLIVNIEATIYKETKSQINENQGTGHWVKQTKENTPNEYDIIDSGTKVTYTGTYKKYINTLSKEITIYVEVEYARPEKNGEKEKVYIISNTLITEEENQTQETAKIQNKTVTSRAKEETPVKKTVGKEGEEYTVAIAAGHNNTDNLGARKGSLKEEELTIKTAEKVEELLKEYSNIKVVQTGSTSDNPGKVKKSDRKKLARDAKPDLCIQIHYDAGGGSGVQAIYKDGDDVSKQLAEILAETMSDAMSSETVKIPNKGAGPDVERCAVGSLGIIENSATSGFPSVVTEGGFIDGQPDADLLKSNGTDLCAQGIVNGILKYLDSDHEGYTAVAKKSESAQSSIESKVYNLKYVEPSTMEEYISSGNQEALKVFTLDDDGNLITATWSSLNSNITLEQNSGMNFRTALQQYVMPYEYLLYFYMDSNEKDFSEQLAEEVLNTEIVIAVQDNVQTIKTTDITEEKQTASVPGHGYTDHEIARETNITESCTPKIEVTYVDSWSVKFAKESSYSSEVLNLEDGESEKTLELKGTVNTSESSSSTSYEKTDEGTVQTGEVDTEGNAITYTYTKYQKVKTNTNTIDIQYDAGEATISGNENKFVKLYQSTKMYNWQNLRMQKFFMMLERNEKTANLLNLTKYLIYKSTNDSYGVDEFNFDSEYKAGEFSDVTGIYGNTLQEKVWFAIKELGYTDIQVAGAMGNIDLESGGFNPDAVEKEGTGIGLVQWSHDRADKFRAYANYKKVSWKDEDTQIEFLIAEITGKGPAKGHADRRNAGYIKDEKITSTYKDWSTATTIEDATLYFMRYFESPSHRATYDQDGTWGESRLKRAKKYLKEFEGREAPIGDFGEVNLSEENKQKMEKMLAEAVRIANDQRYTYSKDNRYSTYQYDCSSLVFRLYKEFFNISVPPTTSQYSSKYRIGGAKSVKLQPGDVLWRKGHVTLYIGNGKYVAAHKHYPKHSKDDINVYTDSPSKYTYIYRFITK